MPRGDSTVYTRTISFHTISRPCSRASKTARRRHAPRSPTRATSRAPRPARSSSRLAISPASKRYPRPRTPCSRGAPSARSTGRRRRAGPPPPWWPRTSTTSGPWCRSSPASRQQPSSARCRAGCTRPVPSPPPAARGRGALVVNGMGIAVRRRPTIVLPAVPAAAAPTTLRRRCLRRRRRRWACSTG